MQIANCTLILNEFKASVPKKDITPAEAMLLIHMHGENAGGMPVTKLTIKEKKTVPTLTATSTDEQKAEHAKAEGRNKKVDEAAKRTDQFERTRLSQTYKPFSTDSKAITVEKVFPKGTKLPQTFDEVTDADGNVVFGKDGSLKAAAPVAATLKVDGITYTEADIVSAKKSNEALQAKLAQLQEQMAKDRQAQIQQQTQPSTGVGTATGPATGVAAALPPK